MQEYLLNGFDMFRAFIKYRYMCSVHVEYLFDNTSGIPETLGKNIVPCRMYSFIAMSEIVPYRMCDFIALSEKNRACKATV